MTLPNNLQNSTFGKPFNFTLRSCLGLVGTYMHIYIYIDIHTCPHTPQPAIKGAGFFGRSPGMDGKGRTRTYPQAPPQNYDIYLYLASISRQRKGKHDEISIAIPSSAVCRTSFSLQVSCFSCHWIVWSPASFGGDCISRLAAATNGLECAGNVWRWKLGKFCTSIFGRVNKVKQIFADISTTLRFCVYLFTVEYLLRLAMVQPSDFSKQSRITFAFHSCCAYPICRIGSNWNTVVRKM